MKREQIYPLMNTVVTEILGESAIVKEDLSNVVDIGTAVIDTGHLDNYVKSLINHIGKVIFTDRVYTSTAPSIIFDSWEFGSIVEKVTSEMPTARTNESWSLEDGGSYDAQIFYKPVVSQKFFNKKSTFEVDLSITDLQVKESFSNVDQLSGFIGMLYNEINKAVTVRIDSLCERVINNAIGETFYNFNASGTYTGTGVRAVNLLKLYNDAYGTSLVQAKALTDMNFLRFASLTINEYSDRMQKISTLFNIEGKERFTPKDSQKFVALSDFERALRVNLLNANGQLLNDSLGLPKADVVPYWQGSGTTYAFADISKVQIKTASNHDVTADGVLAVLFDREALGVSQLDRRTRTYYNAKAEFTNVFEKVDCGLFNDLAENFIVFYIK